MHITKEHHLIIHNVKYYKLIVFKKTFPTSFKDGENIIKDKIAIALKFNIFFTNIGPKLAAEIVTPKSHNHRKYLTLNYTHNFKFTNVDNSTVKYIIVKLAPKTGFDGISTKLVKTAQDALIIPVVTIINQMLNTGIFQDKLKIAKIYPIHKRMMIRYLPIIDPSHFYHLSQKYLKRSYSNSYMSSSKPTNYFITVNMGFGQSILPNMQL